MQAEEIFLKHLAQTSPYPLKLEVSHAEGPYIYAPDGKRYTDMISGIAVSNIGHRHPKVVEAIKSQVDKYLHVMAYGEFIQAPQNELGLELAKVLPEQLNCAYFVNSGTEANEGAIKLAKRLTGRTELVACKRSYHGGTQGSLSISGNEMKKFAFRPLIPGVRFMEFNNHDDLSMINNQTAAVIVEVIQGDAGVRIGEQTWIEALRKRCDETGAQLIFDEIQTGFGRTGKLFAFEHYGVVPDILTIAKGFGGGMPIGGFISHYEKMNQLTHNPVLGHITTFGGHPVVCAAALANLRAIQEENMIAKVEAKGQLLEETIAHDAIIEIRRKGLMFAVEFHSAELVHEIVTKCISRGVITYWFLSCPESFRIAPPINTPNDVLLEAGNTIRSVIDEVCG
ncbi:aspartate aminotransferase family protein [Roseivirga pacifica]|uniref:aspartate aminotransferase family protein n=1 Tax=Roseivirga pacifica TaxID=1267423 RepID=UPI002095DD63|nr:aspartate aminotransferase family protein [Roseivirga pacifica]MCO6357212.1 aminotransferase class III-fold pyridoxal phosphate-dependent enzyme [Roseivirga pacifica]MCO6368074.1 aminotransferase class III-fold pyridoxal phosphate-dependent enzyme [Roseivirga pacifica]MCO6369444.1 aminotransferase class III-fold pyridoxal phosphate-dependent enzyme [Roseivirga pacifica]MCO6373298.1 aminotransferase class III-fold pyridoxal phosphate-dependent enzyme [Roseivirga pacifica]MCO6377445.1 aminotr